MTIPSDALYAGAIDWNEIYRTYYPLNDIADAIKERLPASPRDPVLFSGFAEVAELLSSHCRMQLVEYSSYMAERARQEYPAIKEVVHADILDHLANSEALFVCIVCRISANWHSRECIDRLLKGISRHPRKQVLIDCFDSAVVARKGPVESGVTPHASAWFVEKSRRLDSTLDMALVHWRGRYQLGHSGLDYSADIAAFGRLKLAAHMQAYLPGYEVCVQGPLLPSDPSFLIVVRAIETPH